MRRKDQDAKDLTPAPGNLRLVHAFLNTADRDADTDELASPRGLAAWLTRQGLLPPGTELDETDRQRMLAVREGWRRLAAGSSNEQLAEELDRALDGALLRRAFVHELQLRSRGQSLSGPGPTRSVFEDRAMSTISPAMAVDGASGVPALAREDRGPAFDVHWLNGDDRGLRFSVHGQGREGRGRGLSGADRKAVWTQVPGTSVARRRGLRFQAPRSRSRPSVTTRRRAGAACSGRSNGRVCRGPDSPPRRRVRS